MSWLNKDVDKVSRDLRLKGHILATAYNYQLKAFVIQSTNAPKCKWETDSRHILSEYRTMAIWLAKDVRGYLGSMVIFDSPRKGSSLSDTLDDLRHSLANINHARRSPFAPHRGLRNSAEHVGARMNEIEETIRQSKRPMHELIQTCSVEGLS